MSAVLAVLASALLAHAGFAALALAMDRHYRSMRATRRACPPRLRSGLRAAGAFALALSLATALHAWPPADGAVAWFGLLTVAALALVLLLAYRPRAALTVGLTTAALGLAAGAVLIIAAGD